MLVADLQHAAGPPFRGDQRLALGGRDADRFLDVDMVARVHRVDRQFGVRKIRRGDGDDVDHLAIEQPAIVALDLQAIEPLGAEFARALGEHVRIDVDEVRDLDVRQLRERARVRLPAPVDADHRDPKPIIRALDLRVAARAHRDAERRACPRHHLTTIHHRSRAP